VPRAGVNSQAPGASLLEAGVFAGTQRHRQHLVGFQVIRVDLACHQELVDFDMFVPARKALCASRRAEDYDVLAGAEVEKTDLAEDAARLAAYSTAPAWDR
jgi:hypothetical protein